MFFVVFQSILPLLESDLYCYFSISYGLSGLYFSVYLTPPGVRPVRGLPGLRGGDPQSTPTSVHPPALHGGRGPGQSGLPRQLQERATHHRYSHYRLSGITCKY